MKRIPSDVGDAFYRVVHDFKGDKPEDVGVPALARLMGMSPGVLYNKANPHDNEHNHNKPTLQDAVMVTTISKDIRIVQAMCSVAGGVFYPLPDLSHLNTEALLNHLTKLGSESADFYRCLDAALRKDDDGISYREFESLETEAHQWISAILETLARVREMAGVEQ
jgi:hypothetical protein